MKNEELFSSHADIYAKYRPTYPRELYDFILQNMPNRDFAWDCGTGNGQAAGALANYFRKVFASDISQKQLDYAVKKDNIEYIKCTAEKTPFNDNVFDLVTVAQAYHWFDFDLFRDEVRRVTKPGAFLAVWSYNNIKVEPRIDELLMNFHDVGVGPYWDSRRKYVTNGLKTVPFEYEEISTPTFSIDLQWSLPDFEGYLESWSAVQHCLRETHVNPIPEFIERIRNWWKNDEIKNIRFPVTLRMGRIVK